MKNKIIAIALTVLMLFSMAISTSALTAQNLAVPTPGGDHIFNADRMMQFIPDTRFHSGIVNGGIINPGTGAVSTYAGVKFDIDTYKGEKCVKVELLEDKVTGYFDFNYYQWNAEAYEPSLDATKYPWLRVRYAYNEEAADIDCMTFFASKDVEVLGTSVGAAIKTWDIANGEGEWMDTTIYLGDLIFEDGYEWSESTIRQFRVQMFEYNENPAAVCYIAGFGFFETEEAAKSYNFATGVADVTPVVTQPVVTEPVVTEPVVTEPVVTEPVVTEPVVTEPAVTEPADTAEVDATVEDTTTEDAASEDTSEEETTEATEEETTEATEEETTAAEEETTAAPATADEEGTDLVLPIAIAAAVIVIAAVVIVLLKKKKA